MVTIFPRFLKTKKSFKVGENFAVGAGVVNGRLWVNFRRSTLSFLLDEMRFERAKITAVIVLAAV